jgi:hypothetical protein
MLHIFLMFAPKIRMNRTEIILSNYGCNSSRFSGPCTHSYVKGIPQKRHTHVPHMHRFSVKRHEIKKTSPYSFPYSVSQETIEGFFFIVIVAQRMRIEST